MPSTKLNTLLLLTLGIHLAPNLANARFAAPPSPPNTAAINAGSVEFVVLGGHVGYVDMLQVEYRKAVLYYEKRDYTYFDPLRGGSAYIPTFETPIHGFGWGR
ncbi:MAG: hypothetical protein ACUVSD_03080 [Thiobacillaceae bacterium]